MSNIREKISDHNSKLTLDRNFGIQMGQFLETGFVEFNDLLHRHACDDKVAKTELGLDL
jgi:hypothetical protein